MGEGVVYKEDIMKSVYTNGWAGGVTVRGINILNTYGGDVFWVDSGTGSNTQKGTERRPFATWVYAMNRCTADNGDIIMVKAGHAETITANTSLAKAGVATIGLGNSDNRPTFTGTAAIDDFDIGADDMSIVNLIFTHTTAAATAIINVGADNCVISGCKFVCPLYAEEAVICEFESDGLVVEDCVFEVTANGPNTAILIEKSTTSSPANIRISRNLFNGMSLTNAWDNGSVYSTGIPTNILIENNTFMYIASSMGGVELTAAATGVIQRNTFGGGTLGAMLDPGSCMCFENYEVTTADQTGRVFPTTTAS